MLLYIGVVIWPLILGLFYSKRENQIGDDLVKVNGYLFFSMLPIFILLAFRGGDMGADAGTYVNHFLRMVDTPLATEFETTRMEKGYLIFVKLISYITHSGLWYQVICVSIMMLGIYNFAKEYGNASFLFVYYYCTLGLFFFMFTGTRQCLAMTICLFSYKFAKRKKYIRFFLCILLAFFFHKSSVLFVIVPFIMNMKISVLNTAIYAVLAVITGRYLDSIQEWFNDALDYSYDLERTDSGYIFLIVMLVMTVFSLYVLYNDGLLKEININEELCDLKYLININYVTLFFWIMRLQTRVAERPSYYFMFFSCMLFAKTISISRDKNKHVYIFLICLFTMLLFVYRLMTNFSALIPYQTF